MQWLSYAIGHLESWQHDIHRHIPTYTRYMTPYPMPCHMGSYTGYMRVYTFSEFLYRLYTGIYFSQKYMTSYHRLIWRYRYITVYDGSWSLYHDVIMWRRFSTYSGHSYWCSWYKSYTILEFLYYKNSNIWYMLAHPAQFCSRMLSWLVYACSSCAVLFPGCTLLARLNAAALHF